MEEKNESVGKRKPDFRLMVKDGEKWSRFGVIYKNNGGKSWGVLVVGDTRIPIFENKK